MKEQMKSDFKIMCEANEVDFSKVDYDKIERDNLERFIKHLEAFGEVSEFEYITTGKEDLSYYELFKKETIRAIREMIDRNHDEIRELIFISIQAGFKNEDFDTIRLYQDEEFLTVCRDVLDMDLHQFVESILKDKR